ncbi:outer membrane beta-barrel protein [Mucilaginibacter terrae]|uniref:Outer membrane protein beta-barrel domain-containing protein n=1 Tax=Mucilaginibacter terrae TaxID=1955052 RepID=A0ABU3GVD2_9SPHI|nr:outer membrane beta-barrel protein [Mucilaginibacter terrae]MDT3402907.1 hypothetical protein [Mucilaginibacter terrae]
MKLLLPSFLLTLILCIPALNGFAQTGGTVKAHIIDAKNHEAIDFAPVAIIRAADSVTVTNSTTDKDGNITFNKIAFGSYKLVVKQLGLTTKLLPFNLTKTNVAINLGDVLMEADVKALKAVQVEGQKAPVTIKKDTVEFNAGSFKTQPNDNVEQLLKKLPGVDVDKDGKVTAQGQQVSKVYVDGKEFFGNDPKAATKNLPADAIDKVQLIDDKTEKTKNTGIDDGQREKVLNLTLKADKKKGWFGNAAAAGGNTDRFLGQFNINRFDNKKQISALLLSNNVNESGFTMEDLNNFSGGNIFDTFGSANGSISINVNSAGRANINGAFSGVSGGLITSHSGGLNYSDVWGSKSQLKFNANFVTVISSNNLIKTDDIQNPAQGLLTNQLNTGNNTYNSYRLNMNLEYKMDTLTTLRFKPSLSYGYQGGMNTANINTTDYSNKAINRGNQFLDQVTRTPVFGGQIGINRKLPNGKGSFNFFTTGSYTPYRNRNTSRFGSTSYVGTAPVDSLSNLYTNQNDDASNVNSTLTHVRQLSKKHKINLAVGQGIQYRYDNANQNTLQYNATTGFYDIVSPQYSGAYNNTNWRYTSTLGINQSKEKTSLNINAELANLGLNGEFNTSSSGPVKRNEWAFVPNASFSYRPKQGTSFSVSARLDASLPSITDLQPFINTSNTIYKRVGNPDLNMSRSFNINTNYNTYDAKTNYYFNFYGSYSRIWDGFSTESFFDNTGITTSRPINTDGNYSANAGFNLGKPTKIKGLKLNAGFYGNLNRNVNFINGNENTVLRISPSVNLGSSLDRDVFQLSARVSVGYNNAKNSYQQAANREYYTFNNYYSASVKPAKTWRIFSDLTQSLYRGQPASANTSVYLMNAGIEHYFFKGQNLTLALNGFDLLNQNAGLQRSLSSTGQTTITQTNILGQYFYMKLTYKLAKIGGGNNSNNGVIIMR